jgi:hypothetical protein
MCTPIGCYPIFIHRSSIATLKLRTTYYRITHQISIYDLRYPNCIILVLKNAKTFQKKNSQYDLDPINAVCRNSN